MSEFEKFRRPDDPAPPTPRRQPAGRTQVRTATFKAPDGLEPVEATNWTVKLKWNQANSNQLDGYYPEQSKMKLFELPKWDSALGSEDFLHAKITEFKVVDLTPYKRYQFCVSSVTKLRDPEGRPVVSERSVPIHVVTREQCQPFRPRSVRLDDTHGYLVLTWEEPLPADDVSAESYEYVVEMGLHVEGKTLYEWTECYKTRQREFLIKEHQKWRVDVKRSGDYRFRVSANNTENKEKHVRSLPQEIGDPEIRIKTEAPPGYFDKVIEGFKALWALPGIYMRRERGSIIFVISCHDVTSLRELWMNYRLGRVKKFFQDLLNRQGKPASVATDTELHIKIEKRDFYACRRHLLLTRRTDKGYRVARLGDARSRVAHLGLSEDYPVYCRPTSHRITCAQLDFLDPATSAKQIRAREVQTAIQTAREKSQQMEVQLQTLRVQLEMAMQDADAMRREVARMKQEEGILQKVLSEHKEEIRNKEVRIEAMREDIKTAREQTEANVFGSVTKEIARLKEKDEAAQKSLQEQREEIQKLQETNKNMAARIEALTAENTKMFNQLTEVPDLGEEVRKWREKDKESQKLLSEQKLKVTRLEELLGAGKYTVGSEADPDRLPEWAQPMTPLMPDLSQLYYITGNAGRSWKDLARRLGFSAADIEVFEDKHPTDPWESCMDMLLTWQRRTGKEGTTGVLKEALEKAGLKEIAENLDLYKGPRVYVIHAGEDRGSFVRPLVSSLQQQGLAEGEVFFNDVSISPGEVIRDSERLELVVIVISTSFLNKSFWPKLELETCLKNNKQVFPIWVDANEDNFKAFSEQVGRYSPTLKQLSARRVQRDDVTDELPIIAAEIVQLLSTLRHGHNVPQPAAIQTLLHLVPSSYNDCSYDMSHDPCGVAVIINNIHFEDMAVRDGAEGDTV